MAVGNLRVGGQRPADSMSGLAEQVSSQKRDASAAPDQ